MSAAHQECRTIRDLLAGHALQVLSPEETRAVGAHLAACPACRDEHDCLATVAAHLTALRHCLTGATGPEQGSRIGRQQAGRPRGRRGAPRDGLLASLTLPQWVDRMAVAYAR
ncbi:zf-HC2 domain-containing protein [Streptomyces tropicalis]|uniref:Zf-HC2 domain-containing protein n=1 Tax=Streptomyces tropicalis TaxID=3034234 RepID=A0ABT6A6G3_9ACTN|nr:zf-HC2 domain-containing protein [Streptomyces tropicalis]MDF3300240.1 zf-HC2 domain-containing protein [Streptomyces tropicalis]